MDACLTHFYFMDAENALTSCVLPHYEPAFGIFFNVLVFKMHEKVLVYYVLVLICMHNAFVCRRAEK